VLFSAVVRSLKVVALAAVVIGMGASTPAMAEEVAAAKVNYVALGDSYAAGHGAGTPQNACGQTSGGYPALWAMTAPDAVELTFAACRGATATDVAGQQVAALNADTDLVSITAGGNDLDVFNRFQVCLDPAKAAECVAVQAALKKDLETKVPVAIGKLLGSVKSKAPKAKVALTGYPLPFATGDGCPGFNVPRELRTFANATIAGLNAVLALHAQAAGVTFVDVVGAFTGHDLCSESKSWLVGLEGVQRRTTFHPNVTGQTDGYLAGLVGKAGTVEQVLAWMAQRDGAGSSPTPSPAAPTASPILGEGGGLPVTGVSVAAAIGIGGGLAVLGVVLYMLARWRRVHTGD